MTMELIKLIEAAQAVADSLAGEGHILHPGLQDLVQAVDAYRESGSCLLCSVRDLTEGTPREWAMTGTLEPGEKVTGVVIRMGARDVGIVGPTPYVDLWTGQERVRLTAGPLTLRNRLKEAEAQLGDTLTVTYQGRREIESGAMTGQVYKGFQVEIRRGHH